MKDADLLKQIYLGLAALEDERETYKGHAMSVPEILYEGIQGLKAVIADLEANPPLEALVLAEVDDLMYTFRNSGMSRIWVHFPAPPGVSEGSEIPVTVTIRGRGDVPEPPAISSSIR